MKTNFQYLSKRVGYDIEYDSGDLSDCTGKCRVNGDYCRCGVITNAHVPINVNNPYKLACRSAKNKELHKALRFYCLERMLGCLIRQNSDCFEVSIHSGYYGDEIDGVILSDSVLFPANEFIKKLNDGSGKEYERDLVEAVLYKEYGYLLPTLENKHWNIDQISIEFIKPNHEIYRGSNVSAIDQYSSGDYILSCLCRKVSDVYLLVDGYHRFAAANKRRDKYMTVVWCDG